GATAVLVFVGATGRSAPTPTPAVEKLSGEPRPYPDDVASAAGAVDRLLAEAVAAAGVETAPPVDDLRLMRRLSLTLHGTIPSLQEIRDFEKMDPVDRLPLSVDRLTADRRFSDYFAERLARSLVSAIEAEPFFTYRRRRFVLWLSDQIAAHRPYDEVVRELVASEGLWTDTPAVNYVTGQNRDPIKLAGRTARGLLGLRIDCAECHDHPFAQWKQSDFRGLAAFFSEAKLSFQGVRDIGGELEIDVPGQTEKLVVAPAVPFLPEALPTEGRRRERLAAWVTDPRNEYFSKAVASRVWAIMMGVGMFDPVDDLEKSERAPGVLAALADDFRRHNHDLHRMVKVIAATQAFGRQSGVDGDHSLDAENVYAAYPVARLRPEQVAGAVIQTSSLRPLANENNLIVRLRQFGQRNDFIDRYGDADEEELSPRAGTLPQRLLLMNGQVAGERIEADFLNAAWRVGRLAPNDAVRVETAFLVVLTRRPTPEETRHFAELSAAADGVEARDSVMEDMFWALINSTEFSWNH
ncbi:MAG: DUF1549 domain-containing protein, partial [Planctomycetia bacterium]